MKNALLLFIFLLSTFVSISQVNLVYNGDFEIYDTCPNYAGQISRAVGWTKTSLTPDYYNSCPNINSANGINVPNTQFGYQKDCCGGQGYAGEYMFYKDTVNTGREYICTKLVDTLKAGHKYLAGMYINRCNAFNYSVASISILFTDTIVILPWPKSFISANPQVNNIILVSDTANWVIVQDTFIAVGNETYLTIGNFNSNSTSDTVMSSGTWSAYGGSYYYIDKVTVYDLATVGIKNIKKNEAEIKVYPNPNTGKEIFINTLGLDKGNVAIKITDIEGRFILENNFTVENGLMNIRFTDIKNGVYFIHITNTTSGEHIVKKLVIQY